MKKSFKIILIIVGVLFGVILLDTLQAIIFKNSTFISWKESLEDNDSWVDRGILIDTYYCTKEEDIVTVSWKTKISKYTCPVDNDDELNEVEGVSMIIKVGTLTRTSATVIITDLSDKDNVYGNEFRIDKKENGEWKELEPIIDNYAWDLIGYMVDDNNTLELVQEWEWLYGELDNGEYRLVKSTSVPLEKVNHYFSVEFKID
ncbi:MAG TPA: hypothetical protein PLC53_00120 [Bacilli bacterium]|nr:hypothetical protein [Bacilli bacterium]